MEELRPPPDPKTTTFKLVVVLAMLAVAVTGLVYTSHLLLTLPPAPAPTSSMPATK